MHQARPLAAKDSADSHPSGCCCDSSRASVTVYPFHFASTGLAEADPNALFSYLDDQRQLSGHMSKSSWMLLGSKMNIELDETGGRKEGAVIRLGGSVLGLSLSAEEIVTKREPPRRKIWETVGTPRLLVIGSYRMGFEIDAQSAGSMLRVFIDFDLPSRAKWLGRLLGPVYARWCVNRMISDAVRHFAKPAQS